MTYTHQDDVYSARKRFSPDPPIRPGFKSTAVYFESDPPPLKWSDLRYVFDIQEDRNGKEAIQA
jgi:hypothetical protein